MTRKTEEFYFILLSPSTWSCFRF